MAEDAGDARRDRCGQNSLPIYCLGILLAFASHTTLLHISDGLAMQIALVSVASWR